MFDYVSRLLAFGSRISPVFRRSYDHPYKLNYAATYDCSYRCVHCNIWKKKPENELSVAEVQRFSRLNPWFLWVNYTGGEPFLQKDYVDRVSALSDGFSRLFVLNTTTNAFQPRRILRSVESCLSLSIPHFFVVVSIDGPPAIHDRIRGVSGAFSRAVALFFQLRDLSRSYPSLHVAFGYTLMNENAGLLQRTMEAVRERIPSVSVSDFHLNTYQHSAHYYSNHQLPSFFDTRILSDIATYLSRLNGLIHPISFLEWRYLRHLPGYLRTGTTPRPCRSLRDTVFLDPAGEVYPCTIFSESPGNIRDYNYSLRSLLDTPEAGVLQTKIDELSCPNCWTPCEAYPMLLSRP